MNEFMLLGEGLLMRRSFSFVFGALVTVLGGVAPAQSQPHSQAFMEGYNAAVNAYNKAANIPRGFAPILLDRQVDVRAGAMTYWALDLSKSEILSLKLTVLNGVFSDGSLWVCTSNGFNDMRNSQKVSDSCHGIDRQNGTSSYQYTTPASGKYYVVADNRFSAIDTKHYLVSILKYGGK